MYAPPAVLLPNTIVTVGMPAADICVNSRKTAPPGVKTSACLGRSAPAVSVRLTSGSRFSRATSMARSTLRTLVGDWAPPLTVGSLPDTTHQVPATCPMPVTTPPPTGSSLPHPASGAISRNGDPRSSSRSMRSRTISLPRSR